MFFLSSCRPAKWHWKGDAEVQPRSLPFNFWCTHWIDSGDGVGVVGGVPQVHRPGWLGIVAISRDFLHVILQPCHQRRDRHPLCASYTPSPLSPFSYSLPSVNTLLHSSFPPSLFRGGVFSRLIHTSSLAFIVNFDYSIVRVGGGGPFHFFRPPLCWLTRVRACVRRPMDWCIDTTTCCAVAAYRSFG